MTEEIKQKLTDIKILVSMKQRFTPQEQILIYNVYNAITGDTLKPNSCGICLNNVVTRLKKDIRTYGI